MRADVNLSTRPVGQKEYGTRTEMKNLNSFKAIHRAILYESQRQREVLIGGDLVKQETRRWNDDTGESYAMRSKENAQDYRYFPDPDLLPIEISEEWIEELKNSFPELPEAKRVRYQREYGLSEDAVKTLTNFKEIALLFEETIAISGEPKETANIINGDILRLMNESNTEPAKLSIDAKKLAVIIKLIVTGKINRKDGKLLVDELYKNKIDPEKYVKEKGLLIDIDSDNMEQIVLQILERNSKSIEDYRKGKDKALDFLVGQCMKELKSKSNPKDIYSLLKEKLRLKKELKENEINGVSGDSYTINNAKASNLMLNSQDNTIPGYTAYSRLSYHKNYNSDDSIEKMDLYKSNKYRTKTCGELTVNDVDQKVSLAGWINTIRNHGGIAFLDLRDHYGITQVVVTEKQIEKLNKEMVISVSGMVLKRDEETLNFNLPTGEVELKAENIKILGSSLTSLPFEIDSSTDTREDLRLKYRFLDLRNPKVHNNIILRSQIIGFLRKQMESMDFLEIQTPILANSSPEGARDYLVPSRKHKGKFYALPQAPQQFKQLLMVSGFDKYYQIAPCFRDEDARLDRSPGEFYQLDFEMAFATQEDVFAVAERILSKTFENFSEKPISKAPFIRIPFSEAMLKYGSDKPDLRNPLIISDLSEFFKTVDFKPFQDKIVRGIVVNDCGKMSKSFFATMEKFAISIGMKGLGYITVKEDRSFKGPIDKFFSESQRIEIAGLMNLKPDDVLFFISDGKGLVEKYSGQIRMELGKRMNLIDESRFEFCFIIDFPMYEINEESGKIDFTHNPFSMPQGEMDALLSMDPLEIKAYQYDIVCNGVELSSGAVRNHRPEVMVKAFEIAGYTEDDVKNKFGALYNAFQYGAPPHAGMAPGVDRMVMLLSEVENIREIIAFPLNSNAQNLLFDSPSAVDEKQLREVHIKIR